MSHTHGHAAPTLAYTYPLPEEKHTHDIDTCTHTADNTHTSEAASVVKRTDTVTATVIHRPRLHYFTHAQHDTLMLYDMHSVDVARWTSADTYARQWETQAQRINKVTGRESHHITSHDMT